MPDPADRPLAFVGPPGAGKTLSCAKLATRLVLSGRPPLVVGADAQRAGAQAQLDAYARVLDLPLLAVEDDAALREVMQTGPARPVLLDTAGCDPFEPGQAASLLALLRAAAAVPVLVLPSGLDPAEAAEIARAFAAMGARHLLPTRLDRPRRFDGILAAAAAGPLALTEAGTGPGAADGLTPITPAWLESRLASAPRTITP
ncbi:hypothetical protein ACE7GA_24880 [Roseomonas sp. CCTCC AB2023176]|uniref:hypothetical protein n=1 Tax=Roseomonas sp. CCTCC AB2023176 TaxID=3342640 RepID=UPI0035E1A11F